MGNTATTQLHTTTTMKLSIATATLLFTCVSADYLALRGQKGTAGRRAAAEPFEFADEEDVPVPDVYSRSEEFGLWKWQQRARILRMMVLPMEVKDLMSRDTRRVLCLRIWTKTKATTSPIPAKHSEKTLIRRVRPTLIAWPHLVKKKKLKKLLRKRLM